MSILLDVTMTLVHGKSGIPKNARISPARVISEKKEGHIHVQRLICHNKSQTNTRPQNPS